MHSEFCLVQSVTEDNRSNYDSVDKAEDSNFNDSGLIAVETSVSHCWHQSRYLDIS